MSGAGIVLSDEEDCFGSDVGSSVDSNLCISEQDDLSYADIASVVDFDSEDSDVDFCFNSDEGSVAELEWNTWDEACALDFQNASGVCVPVEHRLFHGKDFARSDWPPGLWGRFGRLR